MQSVDVLFRNRGRDVSEPRYRPKAPTVTKVPKSPILWQASSTKGLPPLKNFAKLPMPDTESHLGAITDSRDVVKSVTKWPERNSRRA